MQAALPHVQERVPGREIKRTLQHRVLQNVRHARIVRRWGAEADPERPVLGVVQRDKREELGGGPVVPVQVGRSGVAGVVRGAEEGVGRAGRGVVGRGGEGAVEDEGCEGEEGDGEEDEASEAPESGGGVGPVGVQGVVISVDGG